MFKYLENELEPEKESKNVNYIMNVENLSILYYAI